MSILENASFAVLAGHKALAWDFDGTLIDHPKSALMHRYINEHPEKRHVIVTFRSHGLEQTVWRELRRYPAAPRREQFAGVISVPYETYERFERAQALRRIRRDAGPPNRHELDYIEWKGKVCSEQGLSVLIDDKAEHVAAGCTKYGICFVNPDDL